VLRVDVLWWALGNRRVTLRRIWGLLGQLMGWELVIGLVIVVLLHRGSNTVMWWVVLLRLVLLVHEGSIQIVQVGLLLLLLDRH
jgi:hypothetical protein